MNIAIDVTGALGPPSGVQRYAEELLGGLAEVDKANHYLVYAAFWRGYPGLLSRIKVPAAPNFERWPVRLPQRRVARLEQRLGWAIQERWFRGRSVDVIHGVANYLPRLKRTPSVVTFHHVSKLFDPESDPVSTFYFRELPAFSLRQATKVIAVSESTKRDLVSRYGVGPAKVEAVWEGGASDAFRSPGDPATLRRLGLTPPYVLFVSGIDVRKNLPALVKAYAALRGRKKLPHKLVLVGHRGRAYGELLALIESLGIRGDVQFLEGLGEADLNCVYRGAGLFVYPSLEEGFGLPVLEAMAAGVPVVAARATCLPEIAGDAALFFEGTDAEDLARQMERVLEDADLRLDLIKKGLGRSRVFDWKETARKTLEVYRAAVATPR